MNIFSPNEYLRGFCRQSLLRRLGLAGPGFLSLVERVSRSKLIIAKQVCRVFVLPVARMQISAGIA